MDAKIALAILVTFLSITAAEGKNNPNLKYDDDNAPLFGYRNSPIELGLAPEKCKRDTSQKLGNGEAVKRRQRQTTKAQQQQPQGRSANTDLGKRQRQKKIRYLLRSKSGTWEELDRTGYNVSGKWDSKAKVKVLIHGYSPPVYAKDDDIPLKTHVKRIGDAYAASGVAYNVIVVDWTSLSTEPLYKYHEAAISTAYAGEDVAEFLRKLKSLGLISSWEDVHIAGLSLGAHVAGVAGATIIKSSGGGSKVGRITGIDPAGPLFDGIENAYSNRTRPLNKDDANFVDVIHCNMGTVLTYPRGRFGTSVQSGHADFYPDGGESQGKCTDMQNQIEGCSHVKCPWDFARSVSEYFTSCPCTSWEEFRAGKCPCSRSDGYEMAMGDQCSSRARGKYYRFM